MVEGGGVEREVGGVEGVGVVAALGGPGRNRYQQQESYQDFHNASGMLVFLLHAEFMRLPGLECTEAVDEPDVDDLGLEVTLECPEFTRHEGEIQLLREPDCQTDHRLDHGAAAFLSKSADMSEIEQCLAAVMGGERGLQLAAHLG